jgi:hypothetical protein
MGANFHPTERFSAGPHGTMWELLSARLEAAGQEGHT